MTDENPPPGRSHANSTKVALVDDAQESRGNGKQTAGTNTAGADAAVVLFPRPKRLRRRRRWIISGAVSIAVLCSLLGAAVFSPVLALKNISVQGNTLVSDDIVVAALEPLIGTPLPQITGEAVRSQLADMPQIRDVSIAAHPPSSLVIHLTERAPVALLKDGKRFVLIDASGTRLGTVESRTDAALPVIDGGSEKLGANIFEAITGVLAALPAQILSRLKHASADSIDSVELTLESGERVLWGNASQKDLKAQVLQALLDAQPNADKKQEKQEKEPVKVYDVSTPTRPVTR